MKLLQTLVVLLSVLSLTPVHGLYFYLKTGEKKCFIEETPANTLLMGVYKLETGKIIKENPAENTYSEDDTLIMNLTITDPTGAVIVDGPRSGSGRFSVPSSMQGEHTLCFSSHKSWFSNLMIRVHFDLLLGDHATDYSKIAREQHLSALTLKIRQIDGALSDITREQDYQKLRVTESTENSVAARSSLTYFFYAKLTVILVCCAVQLHTLRRFFKARRLV